MKSLKIIISLVVVVAISLFSNGIVGASSEDYAIVNDVNEPSTVEEIKYEITVFDLEDSLDRNDIYVILDNYTGNEHIIGEFIIIFGVRDSHDYEVTFAITVKNVDVQSPMFVLASGSTLNIPQYSILESTLPNIKAIDAHEGDLSLSMSIQGLNEVDTSVIGDYDLTYSVSDSTGNTTTTIFTVKVVDAMKPVISGPNYIIKRSDTILDGQFYLKYFTSSDDQDGNLTSAVTITSDTYIGNASNEGIYEVMVSVSDAAGNTTFHPLTIEVVNNMMPKLIIDNYYWVVSNNHEITVDEFVGVLQNIDDLPNYTYIFTTLSDDYTTSFDSYGTYQKSFSLLSDSGLEFSRDITLEVVETSDNVVIATPSLQKTIVDKAIMALPWVIGIGVAFLILKKRKKKRGY